MVRDVLVAGNWKMNGTMARAAQLAEAYATVYRELRREHFHLACLPPAPYLHQVREALGDSGVSVGAQDVSPEQNGAFTGDVSAEMLADLGCRYVVIGHSERREYHGEDTPLLQRKLARARECGLVPIICVGEPLPVRQRGAHAEFVSEQVEGLFAGLAKEEPVFSDWVLAYEPIWAIGTGEVATPEQAQQMCAILREQLVGLCEAWQGQSILYGGSVKGSNAAELASQPDVDGFLVGGASLKVEEFTAIVRHASATAPA